MVKENAYTLLRVNQGLKTFARWNIQVEKFIV